MDIKIGHSKDWKFGIITRNVTRLSENEYQIDDTSSGWQSAFVDKTTLDKLTQGELELLDLDWE